MKLSPSHRLLAIVDNINDLPESLVLRSPPVVPRVDIRPLVILTRSGSKNGLHLADGF